MYKFGMSWPVDMSVPGFAEGVAEFAGVATGFAGVLVDLAFCSLGSGAALTGAGCSAGTMGVGTSATGAGVCGADVAE